LYQSSAFEELDHFPYHAHYVWVIRKILEERRRIRVVRLRPPLQSKFQVALLALIALCDRRNTDFVSVFSHRVPDLFCRGPVAFRGQSERSVFLLFHLFLAKDFVCSIEVAGSNRYPLDNIERYSG
jgi:hypothetical protein